MTVKGKRDTADRDRDTGGQRSTGGRSRSTAGRRSTGGRRAPSSGPLRPLAPGQDRVTVTFLTAGDHLSGRYRLVREIARGGMGIVFEAEDETLENLPVAIKVLPPELSGDEASTVRMKREALAAKRISHPHVMRLDAFEQDGEVAYLVMEYLSGENLAVALARRERLSFDEVGEIARQVTAGLAQAHRLGVVHRDIKPANLQYTCEGEDAALLVKITDFGIAAQVKDSITRLTGVEAAGTLLYAPPEQLRGERPSPRGDQYSLAATLFELLDGDPPFFGAGLSEQIRTATPREIPDVPEHVNPALRRALAKDPAERFETVEELLAALEGVEVSPAGTAVSEKALTATPVEGDPEESPGRVGPTPRAVSGRRWGAGLLVVALIGLGAWGAGYLGPGRDAPPPVTAAAPPTTAPITRPPTGNPASPPPSPTAYTIPAEPEEGTLALLGVADADPPEPSVFPPDPDISGKRGGAPAGEPRVEPDAGPPAPTVPPPPPPSEAGVASGAGELPSPGPPPSTYRMKLAVYPPGTKVHRAPDGAYLGRADPVLEIRSEELGESQQISLVLAGYQGRWIELGPELDGRTLEVELEPEPPPEPEPRPEPEPVVPASNGPLDPPAKLATAEELLAHGDPESLDLSSRILLDLIRDDQLTVDASRVLVEVYLQQRDYPRALETLDLGFEYSRDVEFLVDRARLHVALGDEEPARDDVRRGLAVDPRHPGLMVLAQELRVGRDAPAPEPPPPEEPAPAGGPVDITFEVSRPEGVHVIRVTLMVEGRDGDEFQEDARFRGEKYDAHHDGPVTRYNRRYEVGLPRRYLPGRVRVQVAGRIPGGIIQPSFSSTLSYTCEKIPEAPRWGFDLIAVDLLRTAFRTDPRGDCWRQVGR